MSDDIGARVEALLAELGDQTALGEQLVAELVGYYGSVLERVTELAGQETVHRLAADPLVESALILHDLHPLTTAQRIEVALDRVRPYLGSHAGGVSFLGVGEDGVARLRLQGSCNGCASSTVTVQLTIEEAVLGAAPELAGVEVEGQTAPQPALLQIGPRPGLAPPERRWLHPSSLELPAESALAAVHLDGRQVFMARIGGTYYAYADACAACGHRLTDGALEADVLTCAGCGARFDVRLAGTALDGSGRHLDPLPLLDDVSGIRIAMVA